MAKMIYILFRNDDPGALSNPVKERKILEMFEKYNVPQVLAVIPYNVEDPHVSHTGKYHLLEENPEIVALLKEYHTKGLIEIAQHGFTHQTNRFRPGIDEKLPSKKYYNGIDRPWAAFQPLHYDGYSEFNGLPLEEQKEKIVKGKEYLERILGIKLRSFIFPWNSFNPECLELLRQEGFRFVPAEENHYIVPRISVIGCCNWDWEIERFAYVLKEMECSSKSFLIQFSYHSWGISEQTMGKIERLLKDLSSKKNVKFIKPHEIAELVPQFSFIAKLHCAVLWLEKKINFYLAKKSLAPKYYVLDRWHYLFKIAKLLLGYIILHKVGLKKLRTAVLFTTATLTPLIYLRYQSQKIGLWDTYILWGLFILMSIYLIVKRRTRWKSPVWFKRVERKTNVDNPKVSIILAISKQTETLAGIIKACLNQTYRNIELIIIDDTVNAQTQERIKTFTDSRIRVICNQKRKGRAASWNEGLNLSQSIGEHFLTIDETTLLFPQAVEEMLKTLLTQPQAEMVYSDFDLHYSKHDRRKKVLLPHYVDIPYLNKISPFYLFSRRVLETIGGYEPKYQPTEQYDYWLRIMRYFKIKHYPSSLCESIIEAHQIKKMDWVEEALMTNVLKYNHGHSNLSQFSSFMESFLKELWWDTRRIKDYFLVLGEKLLKICSISLPFGLFLAWVFFCTVTKKVFNPILKFFAKIQTKAQIFFLRNRLKRNPGTVHVLCLIPELVVGGSEKVVGDIVRGLTPQGYRFHLLGARKEKNEWCKNLCRLFDNVVLLPEKFKETESSDEEDYYLYVSQMIKVLNAALVLISNPQSAYRILPRLKKDFPHVKVVDLLHVEKYAGTSNETLFAVPFLDRRICISEHLKKHMIEKYQSVGIDLSYADRMSVIHNGHEMDQFQPQHASAEKFRARYDISPEDKIIVYVGRMSAEKRPGLFVDIAKEILQQNPKTPLVFVMAGDGPDLKYLKRKIEDYGIAHKFILTGMIKKEEVKELLADSYLILIVSEVEGLPLVLAEAMSMNVPVISTDVGAVKEVIEHGINGFLVDPQNGMVESFSFLILNLLNDQNLYQNVTAKTRSSVSLLFAMENMVDSYAQRFNELLNGSERRLIS